MHRMQANWYNVELIGDLRILLTPLSTRLSTFLWNPGISISVDIKPRL